MSTTLENNLLIARFMGFEMTHKINYVPSSLPNCMKNHEHLRTDNEDNLPFHSNWNWIMPVVERIESLFDEGILFYIKDRRAYLEFDTQIGFLETYKDFNLPDCYSGFCDSKIEAVYNTVVEFIKWYNKQKE